MNKILISIVLLSVIALLLACGREWPPREIALKHHFETHRKAYEQLEEKLRSSNYTSVSKNLADSHSIHVKLGDEDDLVSAEDNAGWRELLLNTNTIKVFLADGGFRALVMMSQDAENRVTSAFYARDANFLSKLPKCLSEHGAVRCGMCYVALDEQWGLAYEWWPGVLLPEAQEKARTGELSGSEYYVLLEAAKTSCWTEGSNKMGFEIP